MATLESSIEAFQGCDITEAVLPFFTTAFFSHFSYGGEEMFLLQPARPSMSVKEISEEFLKVRYNESDENNDSNKKLKPLKFNEVKIDMWYMLLCTKGMAYRVQVLEKNDTKTITVFYGDLGIVLTINEDEGAIVHIPLDFEVNVPRFPLFTRCKWPNRSYCNSIGLGNSLDYNDKSLVGVVFLEDSPIVTAVVVEGGNWFQNSFNYLGLMKKQCVQIQTTWMSFVKNFLSKKIDHAKQNRISTTFYTVAENEDVFVIKSNGIKNIFYRSCTMAIAEAHLSAFLGEIYKNALICREMEVYPEELKKGDIYIVWISDISRFARIKLTGLNQDTKMVSFKAIDHPNLTYEDQNLDGFPLFCLPVGLDIPALYNSIDIGLDYLNSMENILKEVIDQKKVWNLVTDQENCCASLIDVSTQTSLKSLVMQNYIKNEEFCSSRLINTKFQNNTTVELHGILKDTQGRTSKKGGFEKPFKTGVMTTTRSDVKEYKPRKSSKFVENETNFSKSKRCQKGTLGKSFTSRCSTDFSIGEHREATTTTEEMNELLKKVHLKANMKN
uniref:Tudor domain-containing protein n=1 Tax=Rhabditophanes sp. KR3021 TaxID=114890 RepID=A0AC35TQ04_9BILA